METVFCVFLISLFHHSDYRNCKDTLYRNDHRSFTRRKRMDTQSKTNKPLHKGTVISCIVVSIVWSLYNTMIGPNLPFIIRTYQDHVSFQWESNGAD